EAPRACRFSSIAMRRTRPECREAGRWRAAPRARRAGSCAGRDCLPRHSPCRDGARARRACRGTPGGRGSPEGRSTRSRQGARRRGTCATWRRTYRAPARAWDRTSGLGLLAELAELADQALRAAGLARDAHVAAVQDQPVVRVLEKLRRGEFQELLLHLERVLAR